MSGVAELTDLGVAHLLDEPLDQPAVQAYQLTWEPSLFVTDASGTVVDRLDITFSPEELREVLARAGA